MAGKFAVGDLVAAKRFRRGHLLRRDYAAEVIKVRDGHPDRYRIRFTDNGEQTSSWECNMKPLYGTEEE